MTKRALLVELAAVGQRLDLFVGQRLELTRSRLKALFDEDLVRVDGRKAKKGQLVTEGQRVEVELEELVLDARPDASMALTILWEDDTLVFVDKPPHVPSQPLKADEQGTVANALIARSPELLHVGLDSREAGLVHRLDVETSGVLLAAKTRAAWEALRAQFSPEADGSRSDVDKRYLALVTGALADSGEIDLPLEHHGDHVRPSVGGADARPAVSTYEVLKRRGAVALVKVRILTGVLHQVRAHLAAVGAPIWGDTRYGGRPAPELGRFFLHASSLAVSHPKTGQRVVVESPLPAPLSEVLTRELEQ